MKSLHRILVLPLSVLTVTFCTNDPLADGEIAVKKGFEGTVYASFEPQSDSRTALASDGASVSWMAGDSFAAFGADGTASRFTLEEGAGTASGKFTGTFAGGEPYTLLYPWSENASLSGKKLSFRLPHEQAYVANTFAAGSSPAIALCDAGGTACFRNLCGVLKVTVKGRGQQLKKIVLQDLAGNMLWGDATLNLDGKQGSDTQTMTLQGGDNTLALTMGGITINATSPKTFYFVVPAGTLDRGFTLAFHTLSGQVYGFLQTQTPNIVLRSVITEMPVATTSSYNEPADEKARGFYKDLFMDSGIYLTSRKTLPAAELLEMSMEYFASNTHSPNKLNATDTTLQNQIYKGYNLDLNGVLLYPDGEPRFRLIYMNGGNSREHGKSLYSQGVNNIHTFVADGGSFTGSCAGSFFASKGYDSNYPYKYYANVWPGHTYHTKTDSGVSVKDTYTSLSVEPGCPLLDYYDLGTQINGVRHNGGSYVKPTDSDFPAGTEILMRYFTPGKDSTKLNGSVNAWAYKASSSTGRVVVSGSHPEGVTSGIQLKYMASMLAYAADGVAPAEIRNISFDGNSTGLIGDRQYHHYKFTLDKNTENVKITLSGKADADLCLSLRRGDRAWITDSQYVLATEGCNKTLEIKELEAGDWYIGVYCPLTVTATRTTYSPAGEYFKYTGRTDLLNGVDYELSLTSGSVNSSSGDEFEYKQGNWN